MKTHRPSGKTGSAGARASGKQPGRSASPPDTPLPYAGKPLDGSQYHDVIEEQEYAERRPSKEEQLPRHSYLEQQHQRGTKQTG